MYEKSEKTFKIATIVLALVLVIVLGYVAYGKFESYQTNKFDAVYKQGLIAGATNAVTQIFLLTENCAVVPLTLANNTRNIADAACIQKAIQQGAASQAKT